VESPVEKATIASTDSDLDTKLLEGDHAIAAQLVVTDDDEEEMLRAPESVPPAILSDDSADE
jgi:hypothetical protein